MTAIVGALACQNDSYLRSYTTTVTSCVENILKAEPKGKSKNKAKGKKSNDESSQIEKKLGKYEVELENTILFPEGGGQPSDTGTIKILSSNLEIPVLYVRRDGLLAKHEVEDFIEPGTKVELNLKWSKRYDHMQQHTGQHLLSAILDKMNLNTLSWSMGEVINYIELPRKLTNDEIEKVSKEVNDSIKKSIPVRLEIPNPENVNKSKMPDDYDTSQGILRVIHIGELDSNPCCGTHLKSTFEIGLMVLLYQTSIRGTNSRLHFICGDRIVNFTIKQNELIRNINSRLSCQQDNLEEKILQVNSQLRKLTTKERNWMSEVASYEAKRIKEELLVNKKSLVYRSDSGMEYLNAVLKELNNLGINLLKTPELGTLLLFCGEREDGGAVIIQGEKCTEVSTQIKELIKEIKGGGAKGKWQGKVLTYNKGEVESVKRYFEQF